MLLASCWILIVINLNTAAIIANAPIIILLEFLIIIIRMTVLLTEPELDVTERHKSQAVDGAVRVTNIEEQCRAIKILIADTPSKIFACSLA